MSRGQQESTEMMLSFTPEFKDVSNQRTTLTFVAHLTAPTVVEDDKRSDISLTAVIDKSGSMTGAKLDLVQKSCDFMLNQLGNNDKMGLVTFDTDVSTPVILSRTSDSFKTEAADVIKSITSGTATNLSGGLFAGVKQQQDSQYVDWDKNHIATDGALQPMDAEQADTSDVQIKSEFEEAGSAPSLPLPASVPMQPRGAPAQAPQPPTNPRQELRREPRSNRSLFNGMAPPRTAEVEADCLRSVFLFTDGQANLGVTSSPELVRLLGNALDSTPRVRVCTFGFGGDHCPDLLSELATAGAGTYYFLESEEKIPKAFADALGGLLSVAAQNVQVEFRPAPGVRVAALHTGFRNSEGCGGSRSVDVGDVLGEESKDLLFDLELPAAAAEGEVELGVLGLSYLDVQGARLRSAKVACKVNRVRAVPAEARADETVALHKARMETAAGLGEAQAAAEAGRWTEAEGRLEAALGRVRRLGGESALKTRLAADLEEAMAHMRDRSGFRNRGRGRMVALGKGHREQRSACLSSSSDEDEDEDGDGDGDGDGQRPGDGQAGGGAGSKRGGEWSGKGQQHSYANGCQKRKRAQAKALLPAPPTTHADPPTTRAAASRSRGKGGTGLSGAL